MWYPLCMSNVGERIAWLITQPLYPYLCGTCGREGFFYMFQMTKHWNQHRQEHHA